MIQGHLQGQNVLFKVKLIKTAFFKQTQLGTNVNIFGVISTTESMYDIQLQTTESIYDLRSSSRSKRKYQGQVSKNMIFKFKTAKI